MEMRVAIFAEASCKAIVRGAAKISKLISSKRHLAGTHSGAEIMPASYVRLSHALRHQPWLYELELDEACWVPIEALLEALRVEKPAWADLSQADLACLIEQSEKKLGNDQVWLADMIGPELDMC